MLGAIVFSLAYVAMQASPPPDKIVKETFGARGRTRAYYLLVPGNRAFVAVGFAFIALGCARMVRR